MNDLTGLILCGGKSSRLGFDKLEIIKEDLPIYIWWKTHLEKYCNDVFFSTNEALQIKFNLHPIILDSTIHQGPLGGLVSLITMKETSAIFLTAIDLCYINIHDIEFLISNRNKNKNATCILANDSPHLFPLFTIFESSIYEHLIDEYNNANKSILNVLRESEVEVLRRDINFTGINTPDEFQNYLNSQCY